MQTKWQLKEGVQRHAACVDGGDSGRRRHNEPLEAFLFDFVQERGLARTRLASQKDVLVRMTNVLKSQVELWVRGEFHSVRAPKRERSMRDGGRGAHRAFSAEN